MLTLLKYISKRPSAVVGLYILAVFVLIAILAPVVAPYDPQKMSPGRRLQPPNTIHFFGTDHFGRDVVSRVIYGARISLIISFAVALSAGIVGIIIGVFSGYFARGGFFIMRLIDILMAFPDLMLALAFVSVFQAQGLINVILALALSYTPRMVRTVYGMTLKIKEVPYVEAALAIGASSFRVLTRHIVPNLISPIIVQCTFAAAWAILAAAALDFLGVGMSPETPSWGGIINEGRLYISIAPWLVGIPGACIALLTMALNLLGDGLRDALDPRLRRLT